ncbi:hypothetical protein Dtox_3518 [Desulfofarcimen acetoxidans DSM 771]|uniref:YjcQ protein n=1 Tax=Desulfofarcimen acetoxidans (strain ATCC 49208 / DSM 771 / KCTC 5769 / VKM B-1644 / 5575) TaxID=485916 RepID=C8VVU8_DESAS|nr:hypothetical protein [Desulfofarcimen acetoxidans]ACV64235.1 hypothetical protein Dtox_3518 [Desulfofarcimen acetoxidans DSM 771]
MGNENNGLNAERLLAYLYIAQQHSFFGDLAMGKLLQKLDISNNELIAFLKECIDMDWLSVKNFNARYFLRPECVADFPVIISSTGIKHINENNLLEQVNSELRDLRCES